MATHGSAIYTPLGENEIRLVKLHAGSDGSIHCTLIHAVGNSVPYEALSYIWGSQDQLETIFLNGQSFSITQNLHQALLRLRHPTEERVLWIDALAINQKDVQERNSQVAKMAAIYSDASETVIWLGEDLNEAGEPKYWIRFIFDLLSNIQDTVKREQWADAVLWAVEMSGVNFYLQYTRGICEIANLQYWRRVWILQESMYSRTALLMFGPYCVPFDLFHDVFEKIYETVLPGIRHAGSDSIVAVLGSIRDLALNKRHFGPGAASNGQLFTIYDWLTKLCPWRQCTDPRDKVFGFYHCFEPEIRSKIQIDYSLTPCQVFTAMMRLVISSGGHLEALCGMNRDLSQPKGEPVIPSWVLDFGEYARFVNPFVTVSGELPAGLRVAPYHFSDDGTILHVKGLRVGVITKVSPQFRFPWEDDKKSSEVMGNRVLDHLIACSKSLEVQDDLVSSFIDEFMSPDANREELDFLENLFQQIKTAAVDGTDGGRTYKGKSTLAPNSSGFNLMVRLYDHHNRQRMFTMIPDFPSKRNTVSKTIEFGIGPLDTQPSDQVYLVAGCSTPLVIRPVARKHHVLVGWTHVDKHQGHGMDMLRPDCILDLGILEDIVFH